MVRTAAVPTDTSPFKHVSSTDPAVNAAVSTDIIDNYSAVIITTTAAGNAQTLQDPTSTTEVKRFSVVNNDTSTDPITVNGTVLAAGEVIYFVWDGSAWADDAGGGGTGDVSKVGTPVANQIGIWTGDGTIKGDAGFTYNTATDDLNLTGAIIATGNLTGVRLNATTSVGHPLAPTPNAYFTDMLVYNELGATGTRVVKGWFDDLTVTNAIAGSVTGNAATVSTITGLAPDTATTQATQASITTCANLVSVGALNSGSIASGFGAIDTGASNIITTGTLGASGAAIADGVTATTQAQADISTKVATTAYVDMTPTPGSDLTGSGDVVTMTVDANATGIGAALHVDTDGNLIEADADAATTMPVFALALETGTGSKKVLLKGFMRDDSWTWTVGGTVYASATTGAMTQTPPAGTGDQVQVLGVATHADRLEFNPCDILIEIA